MDNYSYYASVAKSLTNLADKIDTEGNSDDIDSIYSFYNRVETALKRISDKYSAPSINGVALNGDKTSADLGISVVIEEDDFSNILQLTKSGLNTFAASAAQAAGAYTTYAVTSSTLAILTESYNLRKLIMDARAKGQVVFVRLWNHMIAVSETSPDTVCFHTVGRTADMKAYSADIEWLCYDVSGVPDKYVGVNFTGFAKS